MLVLSTDGSDILSGGKHLEAPSQRIRTHFLDGMEDLQFKNCCDLYEKKIHESISVELTTNSTL